MNTLFPDSKETGQTIRQPATAQLLIDTNDRYVLPPPFIFSTVGNVSVATQFVSTNIDFALFVNPSTQSTITELPLKTFSGADQSLLSKFYNPTPSVQLNFDKKAAQLQGYFHRLAITDYNLQWRTANINDRNNIFEINNSTINEVSAYELPGGFYNHNKLASTMESLVNSDGMFSTMQFSTVINPNGSIQFYSAAGHQWQFNVPSAIGAIVAPSQPWTSASLKFYNTLGLPLAAVQSEYSSITSLPTSLAYTKYIDICSEELTKFQRVKDSMTRSANAQQGVLARIYLVDSFTSANPLNSIVQNPFDVQSSIPTPKQIRWNPSEYVYNFDLTVYDEYGDVLFWDANNSTEYQLTMQASET